MIKVYTFKDRKRGEKCPFLHCEKNEKGTILTYESYQTVPSCPNCRTNLPGALAQVSKDADHRVKFHLEAK